MQTPTTSQVRRYYQAGFTLIELLIVIAIIGILAAIAVPQYGNYLDRSAVTACQAELSSFRSAAIAAAASTSTSDNTVTPEDVNMSFQSCDIDDNNTEIGSAFITSGDSQGPITTNRPNADTLRIEDGRIIVGAAPDQTTN